MLSQLFLKYFLFLFFSLLCVFTPAFAFCCICIFLFSVSCVFYLIFYIFFLFLIFRLFFFLFDSLYFMLVSKTIIVATISTIESIYNHYCVSHNNNNTCTVAQSNVYFACLHQMYILFTLFSLFANYVIDFFLFW